MFARVVSCAPDPLAMARKLALRPGLALLHASARAAGDGFARCSFVACDPDGESTSLDPLAGSPGSADAPPLLASFPRFIGVVPYEALRACERPAWSPVEDRPAPPITATRWLDYPAVARIDHVEGRVMVAGASRAAVIGLARALESNAAPPRRSPALEVEVVDDEPPAFHLARVARAVELIHAGDLYQVSLARRIALRFRDGVGESELLELYARFAMRAPSSFGAFLTLPDVSVVSTSPELCLSARADTSCRSFASLLTEPIKGTRPRGRDAEDDRRLSQELASDEKERAELSMIIDVERNDLHRVCAPGSVRLHGLPRIATHRTVHHRKALLGGRAREHVSREEVLLAMLPSGSVTGAPKVRAMEVIRTLEAARRGLYTGAIGYQSHDGGMVLSMAIRTAVIDRHAGEGEYLTGGGIVADSSPERELAETRWKAEQLRALVP